MIKNCGAKSCDFRIKTTNPSMFSVQPKIGTLDVGFESIIEGEFLFPKPLFECHLVRMRKLTELPESEESRDRFKIEFWPSTGTLGSVVSLRFFLAYVLYFNVYIFPKTTDTEPALVRRVKVQLVLPDSKTHHPTNSSVETVLFSPDSRAQLARFPSLLDVDGAAFLILQYFSPLWHVFLTVVVVCRNGLG